MLVEGLSPLPSVKRQPRVSLSEAKTVFNKHYLPIKSCSPRKPPRKLLTLGADLPLVASRVIPKLNDHPTARLYHRFTPDLSFDRVYLKQLVPLRARLSPRHFPDLSLPPILPSPKPLVPVKPVVKVKPLSPWKATAVDFL